MSTNAQPGQTCQLSIQLDAQGNENSAGFSLSFDPNAVSFNSLSLGADVPGGTLLLNSTNAGSGKLGVILGLPFGLTFPAGTVEIAKLNVMVAPGGSGGTSLSFTNKLVAQEIVDVRANALVAHYQNGTLTISSPGVTNAPTLRHAQTPGGLTMSWPVSATGFGLETSTNLAATNWTAATGTLTTNGTDVQITLPFTGPQRYYRLHHP